jgi:hypothetical protein
MFYFFSGEAILGVANGENGGNGSPSNGFCGTNGGIRRFGNRTRKPNQW